MKKPRMPANERRAVIVTAARKVFSRDGYEGAKTSQIAREAGVSEALVYRHFPSKLALYRAVLRKLFIEQDENWQQLGFHRSGAEGLVAAIHSFFVLAAQGDITPEALDRYRLTLASLSGDGSYASLIYRRSQRRNAKAIAQEHNVARLAGDIEGEPLDPSTTAMFIEHIGTMMGAIAALPEGSRPYSFSGKELARHATWFCCRGIGLNEAAIERCLQDH